MQKISLLLLALVGLAQAGQAAEVIHLGIGTQDTTINCAAGGPVVRELRLLDKYLPHDGKYKDATYDIHWVNLPTGAQLNNEVLAGRLDIVSMADFPSILGYDALLSKNDGVKTLYIASLSLGLRGAGNALLVPAEFYRSEHRGSQGQDDLRAVCFDRPRVLASRGPEPGMGSQ